MKAKQQKRRQGLCLQLVFAAHSPTRGKWNGLGTSQNQMSKAKTESKKAGYCYLPRKGASLISEKLHARCASADVGDSEQRQARPRLLLGIASVTSSRLASFSAISPL